MSFESLFLYGSAARGDQNNDSDVDLLGITKSDTYSMVVKKRVNVAIYPLDKVLKMAMEGNLFILHIIEEGKIIYDPDGYFQQLNFKFKFKDSYNDDVGHASDLGWMLIKLSKNTDNFAFLNKRIAWCVRTILIARSAEKRTPFFSARTLASFANAELVLSLIKNKHNPHFDKKNLQQFENFLSEFGTQLPTWIEKGGWQEAESYFSISGNLVGLQTYKHLTANGIDFGHY